MTAVWGVGRGTLAAGAALSVAVAYLASAPDSVVPLALAALVVFLATSLAFAVFPHVAVAASIPLFTLLPTLKTLYAPSIGPVKDAVVIAATLAAFLVALLKMKSGEGSGIDRRIAVAAAVVLGLYVVNVGGGFHRESFDLAWFHGVRLNWEPILFLLSGLVLGGRRVFRWAVVSLVATGVVVALYGLYQQVVGGGQLVSMGYSWDREVRLIEGRLRSFGTLDDPFAYAAFLLLPLTAVLFAFRVRASTAAIGLLLLLGLAGAYVRTSAVILVALLALWVLRKRKVVLAVSLLGASIVGALMFLLSTVGATETQTVQADQSLYLTLNGRTDVWKVTLKEPTSWPLGQGVGEVGVARERAELETSRDKPPDGVSTVDSAYLATIADIGFVGLAARVALFILLGLLAWQAAVARLDEGWLALGLVAVMLVDALTRDSFTGFPTAFLGMLLVGVALASAREQATTEAKQA